jgi:hypothetical protein
MPRLILVVAMHGSRILIGLSIVIAHASGYWFALHSGHRHAISAPSLMVVEMLNAGILKVATNISAPLFEIPKIANIPVPQLNINAATLADHRTPLYPPQIDLACRVDKAAFSHLAGLAEGQRASTVLLVEVLEDGSAGAIVVKIGAGSAAVDAAAIGYARAVRWIPAMLDGKPVAMSVVFGVSFVGLST